MLVSPKTNLILIDYFYQCIICELSILCVQVEKVAPLCGHKVEVPCYKVPSKSDCKGRCIVRLKCGHKCAKTCRESCDANDCKEPTPFPVALPCGHTGATLPCHLAHTLDLREYQSIYTNIWNTSGRGSKGCSESKFSFCLARHE